MSATPTIAPVEELAAVLRGVLHLPGSAGYTRLATPWNVAVPARPLAVVEALDAEDVAAAVRWAGASGVRVAVRCTGHGAVDGLDGELLVHTGRLDGLSIEGVRARIGAGLTWAPVIEAAAARGLAPVCGSAPGVGVVGFLTGGGLGPLSATYGLGSDHVVAFDVVTGDGEIRRASATEHRSLFRALRGGKGAAGIVTAVEIELVEPPALTAGALYFGADDVPSVLHRWAAWSRDLPREATTSAAILRLPPMPGVPAPLAGAVTLAVRFAWTGDPEAADGVLAPIAEAGSVVLGGVGPMPLNAVGMIHADPADPMPSTESSTMLRGLPREAVDALLDVAGPDAASPQVIVELRRLGGAVAEGTDADDSFCGRDIAYTVLAIGIGAGPGVDAVHADAAALCEAVRPWSDARQLPNFAPGRGIERIRAVYDAEALMRLGTVVATYDPDLVLADSMPIREACAHGIA